MRGVRTALAVLAALVTTPWVLLTVFYVGLNEGSSKAIAAVLTSVCAFSALACFIGAVSISRSGGPTKKYAASLMVGTLLIAASFVIAENA